MLTSFEEWKNAKLDELQVGDQNPINNRKMGIALGDATATANPKYMNVLKPKIDSLWRFNIYQSEQENPGSTADPGRMRQLQDQFIRDLVVVVTKAVRGDDAGGGRSVNYNKASLNVGMPHPKGPMASQLSPGALSAQTMGQGPQLK